jgi:hypothetical protein
MRWLPLILWVGLLTGCPAALIAGGATGSNTTEGHAPNATDYASWVDVPQVDLETHSRLSLLPREVRRVSDGSELWLLRSCPRAKVSAAECCMFEFVVRAGVVVTYRTAGTCRVDCTMRPDAKVQACINTAIIPDGYGAHTSR